MQCGPTVEGYRSRGFNSRLAHVITRITVSSGSPHLGYPSLGSLGTWPL